MNCTIFSYNTPSELHFSQHLRNYSSYFGNMSPLLLRPFLSYRLTVALAAHCFLCYLTTQSVLTHGLSENNTFSCHVSGYSTFSLHGSLFFFPYQHRLNAKTLCGESACGRCFPRGPDFTTFIADKAFDNKVVKKWSNADISDCDYAESLYVQ